MEVSGTPLYLSEYGPYEVHGVHCGLLSLYCTGCSDSRLVRSVVCCLLTLFPELDDLFWFLAKSFYCFRLCTFLVDPFWFLSTSFFPFEAVYFPG
jgi:hypothetical protein